MFLNLELKNVKKHAHLQVSFEEGVNAIQGPNYRGKTTLLYGCLLAMFGPSPLPGKASDIPSAGGNGRWYAGLTFAADNRLFRAERTSSTATLTELGLNPETHENGEKILATGPSVVTAEVEKIVGMSAKRFCELRYAEQKKAEVMLTLGVGDVHKIIEEVGGVTVVNGVIRMCGTRATELEGKLEGLKLDPDVISTQAAKVAELEQHESLQPAFMEHIANYRTLGAQLREQLDGKKVELSALQHSEQTFLGWRRDMDGATERDRQAEQWVTEAEGLLTQAQAAYDVANAGDVKNQLTESILSLETDLKEAIRVHGVMQGLESTLRTATALLASDKASLDRALTQREKAPETVSQEQLDAQQAGIDDLAGEIAGMQADLKAKQEQLSSGVCGTCKRPFEGITDEHLQKTRAEVALLTERLPVEQTHLADRRKALARATQDKADEAKLATDIERFTIAVENRRTEVAGVEVDIQNLRTESGVGEEATAADIAEIRKNIEGALASNRQDLHQLAQASAKVTEAADALTRVKARRDDQQLATRQIADRKPEYAEGTPAKIVDLQNFLISASADATQNDSRILQMEQVKASTLQLLGAERRLLDGYQDRSEQYRLASIELMRYRALADYLRKNRDRFVAELWDGIMAYAQNFASACTGNAIEAVKREADGSFSYTENGHTFSVKGCASGAQKSIMGLGVQFALAEMLPTTMQTVMLDEPSADMDAEHSAALAALLRASGKQVIMVSHREMDAAVADHVIQL